MTKKVKKIYGQVINSLNDFRAKYESITKKSEYANVSLFSRKGNFEDLTEDDFYADIPENSLYENLQEQKGLLGKIGNIEEFIINSQICLEEHSSIKDWKTQLSNALMGIRDAERIFENKQSCDKIDTGEWKSKRRNKNASGKSNFTVLCKCLS